MADYPISDITQGIGALIALFLIFGLAAYLKHRSRNDPERGEPNDWSRFSDGSWPVTPVRACEQCRHLTHRSIVKVGIICSNACLEARDEDDRMDKIRLNHALDVEAAHDPDYPEPEYLASAGEHRCEGER